MGSTIVTTFVDAIKGFATGVSETVIEVFNKIFVTTEGGLSNLAVWGLVMGAISLGFALVRIFTRKAG